MNEQNISIDSTEIPAEQTVEFLKAALLKAEEKIERLVSDYNRSRDQLVRSNVREEHQKELLTDFVKEMYVLNESYSHNQSVINDKLDGLVDDFGLSMAEEIEISVDVTYTFKISVERGESAEDIVENIDFSISDSSASYNIGHIYL